VLSGNDIAMNFAVDEEWISENPVLPKLKRLKERRDPIILPSDRDIALVIERQR
jgi:integrase/recombinase XerD